MEKMIISVLGDSITAGVALEQSDGTFLENWQDIAAKALNAEFHSFGVGGSTTSGGLSRVHQLSGVESDYTIIEFGMNDSVISAEDGTEQNPLDKFCRELVELYQICTDNHAHPIFMTPNTVIEEYYYERHPRQWYESVGGANAQIKRYRDAMIATAQSLNCPVIDIWLEYHNRMNQISQLVRTEQQGNFRDGVHPYGDGVKLYADTVIDFFKKGLHQK